MASPYIGITGFNELSQVSSVARHIQSYPVGYVMFGFTSSNKRLLDPTSEGKTSPSLDSMPALVRGVPTHHLPMIHYYTPSPETVAEEVIALFKHCGFDGQYPLPGVQLNLEWPDIAQLDAMRSALGQDFKITMQLPKKALELSDYDIVNSLESYDGIVTYVLIDPSGGLGLDFDIPRASKLMVQIQEATDIMPGVAGGFSSSNVEDRINKIRLASRCDCAGNSSCMAPRLTNFCIDAQGKLRTARTRPGRSWPRGFPRALGCRLLCRATS